MSSLLSARHLSKSFASHTLFTRVSMQLVAGDRLGLIGPNGAGKSTLLKILGGLESADEGEVTSRRGMQTAFVPQEDHFDEGVTPMSAVVDQLETSDDDRLDPETRAAITLSQLGFVNFDRPVETLSGGWKKRLSIACGLAHDPEVLMLDEPTNHLDLEGVLWLERFVQQASMAVVIVTHDRRFLENVVTRIVELAPSYPDGTFEVKGNYTEFVRRKASFLESQAAAQSSLANRVRQDVAWLRQGIQGRQTRNKTQVEAADARHDKLGAIKSRNDAPKRTTTIDFQATERKTKKLLGLHGVSKSMGDKKLFDSIDLQLTPGRRIGLVGPNGSGKTTLLRLISGELEPDAGTIKRADALKVVSFTQHRAGLNPKETLQEALCPIGDTVDYRGKPIHVTGWAKKFLFTSDQLSTLVSNLSGGEHARVLIARLMLEPADILLLDEPTNDLDIPSLEVLEQALLEFPGAMMLVTHDRFMLERISTEYLAFDDRGNGRSFDSLEQYQKAWAAKAAAARTAAKSAAPARDRKSTAPKKLSYKLQREADGMEETILKAEDNVERLEAESAKPEVIADHVRHAVVCHDLGEAHQKVTELYERWTELEAML